MRDRVNSRDPRERRTNYRPYLETHAHYLTEIGQFHRAKEVFNDSSIFTGAKRTLRFVRFKLCKPSILREKLKQPVV
jgi:hypothetical protein